MTMITFFGIWFALASFAIIANYAFNSVNPRDDK